MITQLLNEVNKKIETLNNLVQDKEYFEKLDERIEKVNNYVQKQKQEIERLNNIINELEKTLLEWHEYWEDDDSYSWQYKNAYDYLQELKGDEINGR